MSETPNKHIPYVPEGVLDPTAGTNLALDFIDALLQTGVISMALTAPPGGEANGDLYIVATPATGAWAGLEDHLVRYVAEGGTWQAFMPGSEACLVLNQDDGGLYKYSLADSPPGWVLAAGLGDAPSDSNVYGRQGGAWVPIDGGGGGALIVQDLNSPGDVVDPTTTLVFGDDFTVSDLGGGVALVEYAGGGGGGGSAPISPDSHPSSPNAMDDEFEAGSLDGKWAFRNQGGLTAGFSDGCLVLNKPQEAADAVRLVEQNCPAGTWRFRAKTALYSSATNYQLGGMVLYNTSASRAVVFGIVYSGSFQIYADKRSLSTFSGSLFGTALGAATIIQNPEQWLYLEVEKNATHFILRVSTNGVKFRQVHTETLSTYIENSGTIDKIGLGILSNSTGGGTQACEYIVDWFRRMA